MAKKKKTTKTPQLRNLVSRKELQKRLEAENIDRTTISFYRYVYIENTQELRDTLWIDWSKMNMFGRIYVAKEGINAQISIPTENVEKLRNYLDKSEYFKDVPFKIGVEDDGKSFVKLDIKVRPKLVADGLDDDSFDVTNVGEHLSAEKFNEILEDPNSLCFDMRNKYESRIGHFDGAICPEAQTFRDELPEVLETLEEKNPNKDKPVLLYCTGGIRCEKASAFLKHHGYREVGQLHGGIIDYKHQINRENLDNKFRGKNFVFDQRGAEEISEDVLSHCDLCQQKSDSYINCANTACNELLISCADCQTKLDTCCSEECQKIIQLPEEEQRRLRKGTKTSKRVRERSCSCSV